MSVVIIVQARMGSTRLPGKVLADIHGRTMLARVVERAARARLVRSMVVATTSDGSADPIAAEAVRLGVGVFRGNEVDVLDRFYRAALAHAASVVVRITADCPLADPDVIDNVVGAFLESRPSAHFASNCIERSYPRGLDVEVASMSALETTWREAAEEYERAHVFPYIYRNPARFRIVSLREPVDLSAMRWTVDTREDLEFVRAIYQRMGAHGVFSWKEVVTLLGREPELLELNRHVRQKPLEEG